MKPCRKCLLSETNEVEFFKHVQAYVDNIPPEQKTLPPEYKRRLELCKACNHLINGMCILCGCYVEVRAAKVEQHCVSSSDIW